MREPLCIYNRQHTYQPFLNLQIDQAVTFREGEEEDDAKMISEERKKTGHRKIRPKKAQRDADGTIYFTVSIYFAQITFCYFIGIVSG